MVKKSKISLTIKVMLSAFLFTFFLGFALLLKGLTFDTLRLPLVVIKGLYIKLDKKLVVSANSVDVTLPPFNTKTSEPTKNSAQKTLTALKEISWLGNFISPIVVQNLTIHGEYLTVHATNCAWIKEKKISLMATDVNISLKAPPKKRKKEPLTHEDFVALTTFFPEFDSLSLDHLRIAFPLGTADASGIKIAFPHKLSLDVASIVVDTKESNTPLSYRDLNPVFENIFPFHDSLNTVIQSVNVHALNVKNVSLALTYDKIFKVSNDHFVWEGSLQPQNTHNMVITTQKCMFHTLPIDLKGKMTITPHTKEINAVVQTKIDSITLNGVLNASPRTIDLKASTNTFPTLSPLAKFFPQNHVAQEWLKKRIQALHFQAEGHASFSHTFEFLPQTIQGNAVITKGVVIFDPLLPPVNLPFTKIKLTNQGVEVAPTHATLKEISTDNFILHLRHLFDKNLSPLLELSFSSTTLLNPSLNEVLTNYGILLPFEQTVGHNHSDFNLSLNLETLTPHIALRSSLSQGVFVYENNHISFKDLSLLYLNDKLNFQAYNFCYNNDLNLSAHGAINTISQEGSATIAWHHGSFGNTKNPLFFVDEKIIPLTFSYKDAINVSLPTLGTHVQHHNTTTTVDIEHLSKFYPFIPPAKSLSLSDGHLHLVHTPESVVLNGELTGEHHLLSTGQKNISPLPFSFQRMKDDFKVDLDNGSVYAENIHHSLKGSLTNRDINLTHLDLFLGSLKKENHTSRSSSFDAITFKAHNSKVIFNALTIPFDDLIIHHENNSSTLDGHYKENHLHGSMHNNDVLFFAPRLTSDFLHQITGFEGIKAKNGALSLWGTLGNINGTFSLEEGAIKDLGGLNTILAIINTLPSLFSLDFDLGFGAHGLTFNTATASFSLINDILIIDNLNIDGAHTDIIAQGYINLTTREIHLALNVSTIKSLSSIISKIPVAGYLILGDAKNFGTELVVHGTLDQPEVETFITKGFLLTPVNIAKRIITYPLELFRDAKNLFSTTGDNK